MAWYDLEYCRAENLRIGQRFYVHGAEVAVNEITVLNRTGVVIVVDSKSRIHMFSTGYQALVQGAA